MQLVAETKDENLEILRVQLKKVQKKLDNLTRYE
jgi:hypothetical protein